MAGISRSIIQWNGALYVENDEINNQHFKFVTILNDLYEAMLWAEGEEIILETLDKLDEYALVHFAYEEKVMIEAECPYLEEHMAEHNQFRGKVQEMRDRFKKGISSLDLELSAYLNHWMVDHIMKIDKRSFSKDQPNQP